MKSFIVSLDDTTTDVVNTLKNSCTALLVKIMKGGLFLDFWRPKAL